MATNAQPRGRFSRPVIAGRRADDRRWHAFQVVFVLLGFGVAMDIITTAMGYGAEGLNYEQNPVGHFLIRSLGWPGLTLFFAGSLALLYAAVRVLYSRGAWKSAHFLTVLVAIVAFVRWVAWITAVLYLATEA